MSKKNKHKQVNPKATRDDDLGFYQKNTNIVLFFALFFPLFSLVCHRLMDISNWFGFLFFVLSIGEILICPVLILTGFLVYIRCRKLNPSVKTTAKLLIGMTLCIPTIFLSLYLFENLL